MGNTFAIDDVADDMTFNPLGLKYCTRGRIAVPLAELPVMRKDKHCLSICTSTSESSVDVLAFLPNANGISFPVQIPCKPQTRESALFSSPPSPSADDNHCCDQHKQRTDAPERSTPSPTSVCAISSIEHGGPREDCNLFGNEVFAFEP
jgi:hypothetical protein